MRTTIISVLIFSTVLAASAARAQEITKEAKIEQILALTKSESMVDRMFAQMKGILPPSATSTPEELAKAQARVEAMRDQFKVVWAKIRPQYVRLYADTFSDEEIDGLLTFYQSPAGRAMVEKMPELMGKFMALLMPEFQQALKTAQQ